MDPAHRACVSARPRRVLHRAKRSVPRVGLVSSRSQHPVSRAHFSEKPSCFCRINPQSILVQNKYKSALFLFVSVPVVSISSTRNPAAV